MIEGKEQKRFWEVGRVFVMLWYEPSRNGLPLGRSHNGSHFSVSYVNRTAYSETRRFVVIADGQGNVICS
jgi:hypothetical protein